jgi:hypothetical protein
MLRVRGFDQTDSFMADACRLLETGEKTGAELEKMLHVSHNKMWRLLKKLERVSWIKRIDGKYCATDMIGKLNPYDLASEAILGKAARRVLIAIKDFGPLSITETSKLVGIPIGTTSRTVHRLEDMGLLTFNQRWSLIEGAFEPVADPVILWPGHTQHERLREFLAHLRIESPNAPITLYGAPELNMTVISESLDAVKIHLFAERVAGWLSSSKIHPNALVVSSHHAWLRELLRLRHPPSIALRNALLGLCIHGEKPKRDLAEIYRMYNAFAPLSPLDQEHWMKKGWMTIINGVPSFTLRGLAQTRRARLATVAIQETETMHGVQTTIIYA